MQLEGTQSVFTPDPGTVSEPVYCGLCKAKMDVARDLFGPTSSIMAIGNSKRPYDIFTCPYREELWHEQATILFYEAKKSPSLVLTKILQEEAESIVASKKPTKENFRTF